MVGGEEILQKLGEDEELVLWVRVGAGGSAVPAFWVPSPPSLLVDQGMERERERERDQGKVPDKTLPSTPRKDQTSATSDSFVLLQPSICNSLSPVACSGWGQEEQGPLAGFVQLNPPVPPPQPHPAGARDTLGSHPCNASTRSRSSSLPPSSLPSPWGSRRAAVDRGLPRPPRRT